MTQETQEQGLSPRRKRGKENRIGQILNPTSRPKKTLACYFIFLIIRRFHDAEKRRCSWLRRLFNNSFSVPSLEKDFHAQQHDYNIRAKANYTAHFCVHDTISSEVARRAKYTLSDSLLCLLFCVLTFLHGTAEEEAGCRIKTSLLSK